MNTSWRRLLLSSAVMIRLLLGASWAQTKPSADLIITHAKIWTVDSNHPEAQAVAVLGDRIVGVGTDAKVAAWRGP